MKTHPSQAIIDLLSRLKDLAVYAAKEPTIFLSVELEPGPLFVMSQVEAIKNFCDLIDNSKDPALRRCVGLNLDIGHWDFLSGIAPEWLLEEKNKSILNRIVHAHISDHHIGHFSDLSVSTIPRHDDRFVRWLLILQRIMKNGRTNEFPEFSGFVSCEMEACKTSTILKTCFNNVDNLVRKSAENFGP